MKEEKNKRIQKNKLTLDPVLRALVGKEIEPTKEITFEERVERMFSHMATNARRHKSNFKNTNYDLDRKVTKFMKERESRLYDEKEKKRVKDEKIAVVESSDDEAGGSSERAKKRLAEVQKCKQGLIKLFEKYPAGKCQFDSECMDLCIPFDEPISKVKYQEITGDPNQVDQIASILIRYKNLDPSIMEELCFVIPKIDPFDFTKFRDGKVEIRKLRSQILGIKKDFIVNMDDIQTKVNEYARDMELENITAPGYIMRPSATKQAQSVALLTTVLNKRNSMPKVSSVGMNHTSSLQPYSSDPKHQQISALQMQSKMLKNNSTLNHGVEQRFIIQSMNRKHL